MKKNANLPALIFTFALLIIWQAGAMGMNAAYILPSPTQIVVRLWELRKPLFTAHLPATMLCTGVGLAISVALGLLLAIVMDASPAAERMLYPLIIASQTIPTTALAPLTFSRPSRWQFRCRSSARPSANGSARRRVSAISAAA